jgi:predicted amidohydrolase
VIGGSACSGSWTGPPPGSGALDGAPARPLRVKVAAVQCSSDLGEVEANRKKLTALVEEAAANGAKIVVLPEASITGYLSQDLGTTWHRAGWPIEEGLKPLDPAAFAETVPGPSSEHFARLAKRLGVYITVPLVEVEKGPQRRVAPETIEVPPEADRARAEGPRYYNTALLVSPQGRIVAHYRKLHPWPYPEQSWANPGDRGIQVADTEFGRVGLAICYDIHDVLELYASRRLWALLYPIAWVDDEEPGDWFTARLGERVAPFRHYLIGANWSVDRPQTWHGYGSSTILAPDGRVLAQARSATGSEIVYATIPTAG